MRQLTAHKVNDCNSQVYIDVEDEPGSGGANHRYGIYGFNTRTNQSAGAYNDETGLVLLFQNGPIKEVGTNGVTQEMLLAILIDRMEGFQKGQYACRENAIALTKLQEAMHWLGHRTAQRVARGVEGTHAV